MGEVLGVAGLGLGAASLAIQVFDGAVKGSLTFHFAPRFTILIFFIDRIWIFPCCC
jgi:hypothetical protein